MTLQRYLTRLIWFAVIPVLALAMGLGYLQFRQARDDDGIEAQRLADTLADEIDQMLNARIAGLRMLSASPLVNDVARWPELQLQAQGFHTGFGNHVILVDADRNMRLHTGVRVGDALPPLPRPAGRSAVATAFETAQAAVGDPFVGPLAGESMVAVAVPTLRDNKRVGLVFAGLVPVLQLEPLFMGLTLPGDWGVAVHDSRGAPIARRGGAAADAGHERAGDGLRFEKKMAVAPWSVEVRIPRVTYLQHLWGVGSIIALALLGVTLISVLGGQWAARRLARSVRSLAVLKPGPMPADAIVEIRDARRLLDDSLAQREDAVNALQIREEQLRRIFESASEAIVTADESQTIVLANPAAAQIFRRPIEQLVGAPLDSLIPERLRPQHHEDVARFGRSESGTRSMGSMGQRPDVVGLRADGQEFPIEAAISQVHVDGKRLYTVILRDVTERRQAEAAIAAGKARLEATLESMADGLLMIDTGCRIVEVNSAFLRMYGFKDKASSPRTVAEYQQLLELKTPDGRVVQPEQWTMPRALRGESGSGVELGVRHRDSGRSWVGSFSFAPIRNAGGQIVGAVFSVRDVTERKRLEAELEGSHRDLERLVAAQQSVEEEERKRIARELHDELQQVLAAIKMDVGSIEAEVAADPARLLPLVTRIDDLASAAITSSRRIINDLRPLLLEELGLVPALDLLCRQFSERSGIAAVLECDERSRDSQELAEPVAICLYRVAQESLNNVSKHSGARCVQLRLARRDDGGVSLTVRDDGRGMLAADRYKVFSFGLRGMNERVRALGGTLRIDSTAGDGVTLVVEIGPATREAAASTVSA